MRADRFSISYTKEGTFWSNHPYIVLNAPSVTPEQKDAAGVFEAFLLAKPQQLRALETGFRPADRASRSDFRRAAQSLQNQQAQLKNINALLTRFEAELAGADSSIDAVVAGAGGLEGQNRQQAEEKITGPLKTIEAVVAELNQFDTEVQDSPAM